MNRWVRGLGWIGLAGVFLVACTPEMTVVELRRPQAPESLGQLDRDDCLVGTYAMLQGDLDLFLANLIPVPNLRLYSGALNLWINADGTYVYFSDDLVIHINVAEDAFLQGVATFRTEGLITKDGDRLELHDSGARKEIVLWKVVKGSQVFEAPGTTPSFSLIPGGPMSYRCGPDGLELDFPALAGGTISMFFTRIAE